MVVLAAITWGMYSLTQTSKERMDLIDKVFADPNWKDLRKDLALVSLNDHQWRRMTFRDPWTAYSVPIRKLMKK